MKIERLFIVHGVKRSGNHALINWIMAHERFVFINNILPIEKILSGKKTIPPPMDFSRWVKVFTSYGRPLRTLLYQRLFQSKDPVIVSLEDHLPGIRPFVNLPEKTVNVLVLRDPFNLLASRIRKASTTHLRQVYPKETGPLMQRVLRVWKMHAREYLGLTEHLENKVTVYFNDWFSHRDYRQRLSLELGLEFTDEGFSLVSDIGGGSSFDGTSFDGNHLGMNVLDRKDCLTETERRLYDVIIKDDELQELARSIETANRAHGASHKKTASSDSARR